MAVKVAGKVRVAPIEAADVPRAAAFLHTHLNERISAADWARAVDVPWTVERPNAGFMLLVSDEVVGVQLCFYSERLIEGRVERFCNLGAWCVLPDQRLAGLRLLKAALAQEGYHFTDLSPSGNVVQINERLGFRFLDTTTALVPNLPWPSLPGRCTISSAPALIERTLVGPELQLYRDHARTPAASHVVLVAGDQHCYVIFRKDRRKGLPLFASLLHVSDPQLLRRFARPFARHLLLRHGALATLAERRIAGEPPRLSRQLGEPRRKMVRSDRLDPAHVDDLYSELVCVAW